MNDGTSVDKVVRPIPEWRVNMSSQIQACIEVVYTGRVQGVGFRATAVSIARGYTISGWVQNQADGTVRLVAQGMGDEVDRFLDAIRTRQQRFITREDARPLPLDSNLQGFIIRR